MAEADRFVILRMNSGAAKFSFRPGSFEYQGQRYEANQSAGVAESGKVKVARISSTQIRFLEYAVREMPLNGETDGTTSVAGWYVLLAFISGSSLAEMRMNTFEIKPAGLADSAGNYLTVRYWAGEITEQATGKTYAGKLTLRVEAS